MYTLSYVWTVNRDVAFLLQSNSSNLVELFKNWTRVKLYFVRYRETIIYSLRNTNDEWTNVELQKLVPENKAEKISLFAENYWQTYETNKSKTTRNKRLKNNEKLGAFLIPFDTPIEQDENASILGFLSLEFDYLVFNLQTEKNKQ